MAAGDFNANIFPDVLLDLQQRYAPKVVSNPALRQSAGITADIILTNQGMGVSERIENGICTPEKVSWIKRCVLPTVTSGTSPTVTDCDVPGGDEAEADSKDIELNRFCHASVTVRDQDCDNRTRSVELFAEGVSAIMDTLRLEVQKGIAAFIPANAQANKYVNTNGVIVGTTTEYTGAQFAQEKGEWMMAELRLNALRNYINDYIVVDGTNFAHRLDTTRFAECCERTQLRANFQNIGIVQDVFLDDVTGRRSTFLFDPEFIGFYNYSKYLNNNPTQTSIIGGAAAANAPASEKYVWGVNDPILRWKKGNALVPVRWDFEMKKTCTGRDALGRDLYRWDITGYESGLLDLSPLNCDGDTNILEFVNIG